VKLAKFRRLLRTTAVRTSLWYAFLNILLAGTALGVYHWATSRYVDAQLSTGLYDEFVDLRDIAEKGGFQALKREVASRSRAPRQGGRYYLLVDSSLRKVAGNLVRWPKEDDDQVALDETVHAAWIDDDMISGALDDEDEYWPVIGKRFNDGSILLLSRSVAQADEMQLFSIYALSSLLVVIVVLALTMGVFMGRTILRRIDSISATAETIVGGDLSRRMPLSGRSDEFDHLGERLNRMLDRIEQLMQGMREVTDNVAHDLRRPLTRLRNRFDMLLLEERSPEEYRQAMEEAIHDTEDLMKTFNTMLQIAQTEAGTLRVKMEPVDLAGVAHQVAGFYRPVAEQRMQRVLVDARRPVTVRGNRDLLSQALGNLLDNAIKYSPQQGLILVQVEHAADSVRLSVSDTGPGIPAGERERVLQRFTRLDHARSSPGNGLGLSLVNAIARLHQATISFADNAPGLIVTMTFAVSTGSGRADA
jgi:signal transduction histidine kinase